METTFILGLLSLIILSIRWSVALINLISGSPSPVKTDSPQKDVSVLIPARNEAANLPRLLRSLSGCTSSIHEILVYNDQSEDETANVVQQWARYDRRIRLVDGIELPAGWTGKNHACHQLACMATGRFFLFLDADVTVDQNAIDLARSQIIKNQLALFSFFPQQEMKTPGEWMLVTQVNVILVSLLPLALIRYLPFKSMAAANGQFMMFDGNIYRHHLFHQKVYNIAVEDVAISRLQKEKGLKQRAALAPKGLSCRMYQTYHEAVMGLARSARFFFGGSILGGWVFFLFAALGWLPVLLSMSGIWVIFYFSLLITMRIFIAHISGHPILKSLAWMPLQLAGLFHLLLVTTKQLFIKKTQWKGRAI
ncbi:glycosyltransferase [Thermophagus sp. OGC60D27]|uniref:glycosyltransferase n=1 Tax=Thermophagus sp. OGC60D27 TaxID=3458415 RepID=UPI004037A94F